MMEYQGYIGRVEFDDEAGLFHGEVINTRDVITFEGTSVVEIQQEFRASVDVYLDFCAEQGRIPDNPHAGHLVLGIAPELQATIIQAARREHKNLDAWILEKLAVGVSGTSVTP